MCLWSFAAHSYQSADHVLSWALVANKLDQVLPDDLETVKQFGEDTAKEIEEILQQTLGVKTPVGFYMCSALPPNEPFDEPVTECIDRLISQARVRDLPEDDEDAELDLEESACPCVVM